MMEKLLLSPKTYDELYNALKKEKVTDNTRDTKYVGIILDSVCEILGEFGLPDIKRYSGLLEKYLWENGTSAKALTQLEKILKEEAYIYLTSPVKTNRELLLGGKANNDSAFEVLPLMNINTRSYNIFIYEYLWMGGDYSINDVLKEFERYNLIPEPQQMFLFRSQMNAKAQNILRESELQFVEEYCQYIKRQDYISEDFSDDFLYPKQLSVTESFWSFITYEDEETIAVDMQLFIDDTWQSISVQMELNRFLALIEKHPSENRIGRHIAKIMRGETRKNAIDLLQYYKNMFFECNSSFSAEQLQVFYQDQTYFEPDAYILK